MDFFIELYGTLPKNGPGSTESSLRALNSIKNLKSVKRVLDLGCGKGRQTVFLAQNTEAEIIALDILDEVIELLNKNLKDNGVESRVEVVKGSMEDLSFLKEKQDLIWLESSIYNIGLEKGLKYFKDFLAEDGYLAISEAIWFTKERPKEIEDFWMNMYPAITGLEENIRIIESCGYELVNHFTQPDSDWIEGFYDVLSKRVDEYYAKGVDNSIKSEVFGLSQGEILAMAKHEIDMFQKYHEYYGYEFFIMKK